MILSASRRTDIPAFYADWFMRRIDAGFVLTRNPMNHAQLSRIPLSPETVDAIVFWTKDPQPMLGRLPELDAAGYRYYFQFTLTPYGRTLERGLRDKAEILNTFAALARCIGRERVVWRYDPIILNDTLNVGWHREQFARMCGRLAACTDTVTISFVDLYAKCRSPLLREITPDEMTELAGFIGETARAHGLRVTACCEKADLTPCGIERAACIDKARLEKLCGGPLALAPDKNQRAGCGCVQSVDIGMYNTCLNGCVYCYANRSPSAAARQHARHDPAAPLLIGGVLPGETVTERKGASAKIRQTSLF